MRFYSRVLRTGVAPLWRDDLLSNAGVPILGLGAQTPAYADLPLQWMPHIQVADVASSTRRALGLGARELMHAKDKEGNSQWAVLVDPFGAAFGLVPVVSAGEMWSAGTAWPSEASEPLGRIRSVDLTVADAPAARDFYRDVVGWFTRSVARTDAGHGYDDFGLYDGNGNAVGTISHARGALAELPAVWLLNIPVGDLAESLRQVEVEGGTVMTVVANAGKASYAAIKDPVGVAFALTTA
jgi:predicted enzyme related to lactoylglutathione lyase